MTPIAAYSAQTDGREFEKLFTEPRKNNGQLSGGLMVRPLLVFSMLTATLAYLSHLIQRGNGVMLITIAIAGYFFVESLQFGWLIITYWALVIVSAVWRYKGAMDRHAAALNVVLAKHTFNSLSAMEQRKVHEHALEIIRCSGGKLTSFMNETSQYGWYALAMAELGIPPAVQGDVRWSHVRNPNVAVYPGDYWLKQVLEMCQRRFGISVDISDYDEGVELFRKKSP